MFKVMSIVGTRPNFIKLYPMHEAFKRSDKFEHIVVNTGQHFDANMSTQFFTDFAMPDPQISLGLPCADVNQHGRLLEALHSVLKEQKPDLVLVYGDVTSTFLGAYAARYNGYKVGHIEAGLRSGDLNMPEERNRQMTDVLSHLRFVPHESALDNLAAELVSEYNPVGYLVGDLLADVVKLIYPRASVSHSWKYHGVTPGKYVLFTSHRAQATESKTALYRMFHTAMELSKRLKVIFPIHPRTQTKAREFGLLDDLYRTPNLILTQPLSYVTFLDLVMNASFVVTDSGGVQIEAPLLGVPCIIMRESTERPYTLDSGHNDFAGPNPTAESIISATKVLSRAPANYPMHDGKTAQRILQTIEEYFGL